MRLSVELQLRRAQATGAVLYEAAAVLVNSRITESGDNLINFSIEKYVHACGDVINNDE